ncbi:hypothetical protein HG536_0C01700 [Torulaspora globosa]|uniref:Uncharacterized protein n=1 Tax=Torulaspora globosa TaxID=48254 RepID=A0A7G3ZER6_9SACH|nr:uncharacterized protein HG536_0C01700 [Torulaspora globosa]QLL32002.1 hypothetical protein HG536_0C01700 [Torulaspora globosa]
MWLQFPAWLSRLTNTSYKNSQESTEEADLEADMSGGNSFDLLQSLREVEEVEVVRHSSNGFEIEELDLQEAEIEMDDEDVDTSEDGSSEFGSDELDDILRSQLLDAQQQWEESLEQLSKVLNWVLLPLIGKFMGRRTAKVIWQHVMEYLWR